MNIWQDSSSIKSLAELPGNLLASGLEDGTIVIWDLIGDKLKHRLTGHTRSVNSLSGGLDGFLNLWNITNGKKNNSISTKKAISKLDLLTNEKLFASVSTESDLLEFWEAKSLTLIKSLQLADRPSTLILMQNGLLAIALKNGNINIWNPEKNFLVRNLVNHRKTVSSFALLPNGDLISGSGDTNGDEFNFQTESIVNQWDPNTGSLLNTFTESKSGINAVAVLKNGQVAIGSFDNVLRIWDVNQLNFKNDVNLKFSNPMVSIESLCALKNGMLAVGKRNGEIIIYK